MIVGVSSVVTQKDSILGIDFTGGDEMTISYTEKVSIEDLVQASLASVGNLIQRIKNYWEDKEILKFKHVLIKVEKHSSF